MARNVDVIVQYGTRASVSWNSKFYNIILKLFKNSSVVVKQVTLWRRKKKIITLLELCQFMTTFPSLDRQTSRKHLLLFMEEAAAAPQSKRVDAHLN